MLVRSMILYHEICFCFLGMTAFDGNISTLQINVVEAAFGAKKKSNSQH